MTITYSLDVAKTRFCGFTRLLTRWKGSIYKILWKEFLVFCTGYTAISITYRCFLNTQQRTAFENVVLFVESLTDLIPLSFVLGFYVSLVVGRWWAQYDAIPWPDRLCLMIAGYVHGADERSRLIRRTLGRYLILLQALTFQAVSTSVKRRFPTTNHLVAAGIMTKDEQSVYEKIDFVYGKWWVPCQWFSSLLMRAKKERRIKDSILLDGLFRELLTYRNSCGTMMSYDWISVPLVYTQVVTLATYMYAMSLMVGRQYLDTSKSYAKHQVDLYVPFFTVMQFFFYVGWLKVAEQIVNPYGEDDDDFELNWCLDRTVHVVYLIVDHLQTKHPKIRKDLFWDETEPRLPQTKSSTKSTENPHLGSASNLEVEDAKYLDTFLEQDKEENVLSSDSVRQTGGLRSSFIMKLLNPAFGQSFRKKSIQREDVVKNALHYRGYNHSGFLPSSDRSGPSTPAGSRKSSFRSFIKRVSPSHSRTSSISLRPNSTHLRRYKCHDMQEMERNQQVVLNFTELDCTAPQDCTVQQPRHASGPDVGQFGEMVSCTGAGDIDLDPGAARLDILMPPIPEEPSRATSWREKDPDVDDVLSLANEVMKELNRTTGTQEHQKDCALEGYESCCSLASDESSDESSSSDPNSKGSERVIVVKDNVSGKSSV